MTTPNRLFKYVSFTPRVLQQLCMGEVHFADPSTFNDPLDCRPTVNADLEIPDLKEVLAQLIVRRVSKEVSDAMKKLRFKSESIRSRLPRIFPSAIKSPSGTFPRVVKSSNMEKLSARPKSS